MSLSTVFWLYQEYEVYITHSGNSDVQILRKGTFALKLLTDSNCYNTCNSKSKDQKLKGKYQNLFEESILILKRKTIQPLAPLMRQYQSKVCFFMFEL